MLTALFVRKREITACLALALSAAAPAQTTPSLKSGEQVYREVCMACHGAAWQSRVHPPMARGTGCPACAKKYGTAASAVRGLFDPLLP